MSRNTLDEGSPLLTAASVVRSPAGVAILGQVGEQQATQRIERQAPAKEPIDWVKVLAGALAAVTSAVLLSTLGAAGTIIGAALGSMVVTVGNALYSRGLAASKEGMVVAQTVAAKKVSRARRQVERAADEIDDPTRAQNRLDSASRDLDAAESELEGAAGEATAPEAAPWKDRLKALPWKRIALVAGGLFLASMIAITTFELVSGRAVSSYTGGSSKDTRTSFSGMTGGGSDPTKDGGEDGPANDPTQGATRDSTPTSTPTDDGSTPTEEPSASPSSTPSPSSSTSPTPTPSPSVTVPTPTVDSSPASEPG